MKAAAGEPARTRDEDAIGTPPECPTLVPAERYYSPAFAALEIETDSPLTIVTVRGAPLPEKSATVG